MRVSQIAHHAWLAEQWQRAYQYHALAADSALKVNAFLTTVEHFAKADQAAQACAMPDASRLDELFAYERVLDILGRRADQQVLLERMAAVGAASQPGRAAGRGPAPGLVDGPHRSSGGGRPVGLRGGRSGPDRRARGGGAADDRGVCPGLVGRPPGCGRAVGGGGGGAPGRGRLGPGGPADAGSDLQRSAPARAGPPASGGGLRGGQGRERSPEPGGGAGASGHAVPRPPAPREGGERLHRGAGAGPVDRVPAG